jgi:hypothetical protein
VARRVDCFHTVVPANVHRRTATARAFAILGRRIVGGGRIGPWIVACDQGPAANFPGDLRLDRIAIDLNLALEIRARIGGDAC